MWEVKLGLAIFQHYAWKSFSVTENWKAKLNTVMYNVWNGVQWLSAKVAEKTLSSDNLGPDTEVSIYRCFIA